MLWARLTPGDHPVDAVQVQAVQRAEQRLTRQEPHSGGLTQEQLAARAQVAVATVRKIEQGAVTEPGYFTVIGLLDALGVTHEELRL